MNWKLFQWRSLKTRVTLFTLAIFLVGIWSLAFYASRMLHIDMGRLLGDQQFSTVSVLAAEVDQKLDDRLRALEIIAGRIGPALLGNAAALQTFMEQSPLLQMLFNGGTFAVGLDGTAIASVPLSAGRVGVNYMDRDFMAAALKQGKATIGRPLMGKQLRSPVFGMAVPIRDAQGSVIGALIGATALGKPNFLDKVTGNRYGKTGDYLLVTTQHRLIITASQKSRIMEVLPAPGLIPPIDRFIQGYEGSAVYVNPHGVEVLASSKGIPVAGWQVAAILPTAEAFAPIRAMRQRMLLATIFLTLLAGGLTWWMLRRQLAPMLAAVKTLAALSDTNQPAQPLPITTQDEIGDLIGGFNRLLETLRQREGALRESEERFRTLIDRSIEAIAVHRSGNLIYVNPSAIKMIGAKSAQDLVGKPIFDWIHPDYRQMALARLQKITDTGVAAPLIEEKFLKFDGTVIDVEVQSTSIVYDGEPAIQVAMREITERKQMEEQVRQLAFHDALTNLPNRRLLNDRLNQAMAAGKRSGCHGAMMFLDLDNFKLLNDSNGHGVGDLLLIEAAGRLKSCVRETDTVARFGGDEFVVMISELDADKTESTAQAGIIAEKIRVALAKPYVLKVRHQGKADTTVEHQCTASIGVALFSKHEASRDDILKRADTAMYQAKEAGCNLIRFNDLKA